MDLGFWSLHAQIQLHQATGHCVILHLSFKLRFIPDQLQEKAVLVMRNWLAVSSEMLAAVTRWRGINGYAEELLLLNVPSGRRLVELWN